MLGKIPNQWVRELEIIITVHIVIAPFQMFHFSCLYHVDNYQFVAEASVRFLL